MNSAKFVAIALAATMLAVGSLIAACNTSDTTTTNQAPTTASPAATLATATPGTGDNLAAAYLIFQQNCQECHGEKGFGGRVEIKGRKLKVPNLREGHALNHTDEKFVKQISEGDDEMPAFKDKLTPEQINDLVRLIRKEFQGK